MRTIATIAALLLSVCLLAPAADAEAKAEQEAGANGDDVKVLGFTFGKPPPAEAVLKTAAGRYRDYELKHRWCEWLRAVTDNGRVVSVSCFPNEPDAMLSLLKSRYGPPPKTRRGQSIWFTPNGLGILADGRAVIWTPATTMDELSAAAKALSQARRALLHASEAEIDAKIAERENAEGEDF